MSLALPSSLLVAIFTIPNKSIVPIHKKTTNDERKILPMLIGDCSIRVYLIFGPFLRLMLLPIYYI